MEKLSELAILVLHIIKKHTRDNPITNQEVCDMINNNPTLLGKRKPIDCKTIQRITTLLTRAGYKIAIGAGKQGLFLAETDEDLDLRKQEIVRKIIGLKTSLENLDLISTPEIPLIHHSLRAAIDRQFAIIKYEPPKTI